MTDELSRDEVSEILEAIYKENFEMPELRDRIAKIPKLLDKYEGKWDGMLKSAYKKFGKPNSLISEEEAVEEPEEASVKTDADLQDTELDELLSMAQESEDNDSKIARANKMLEDGDFDGALAIWKKLTVSDGNNPANWRGLAKVLDAMGQESKANTARQHADRLETQAIADATGRKMEDIIADLLDDGILNFSAGSDAKSQDEVSQDDDLTKLPGIGAVGQDRLNFAGIVTFAQLAKKSDKEIAEIIQAKKVESWSKMAQILSEK